MKITVRPQSLPILADIDRHVRQCNIRGPLERFRDVAADTLDGAVSRQDLDDLIRRKLLVVTKHGFDDSRGRDPMRWMDPTTCGVGWSVDPAPQLINALWPDRITEAI